MSSENPTLDSTAIYLYFACYTGLLMLDVKRFKWKTIYK